MKQHNRLILLIILSVGLCRADVDVRKATLKAVKSIGLSDRLDAPVKVHLTEDGVVAANDEGVYFFQYDLETPQNSSEPNVIMDSSVIFPKTADKAVFITHGWFDKAQNAWPQNMATAIRQKTEPNEWICGFFGWSGGSGVITSIQAAQYARDVGGPRLAAVILKLPAAFSHIHLVGHSAGSWVVNSAAQCIARENPAINLHLTFLDAYVPGNWDPNELGHISAVANFKGAVWAEHYYTRDITYAVTQNDLVCAHNVDITAVDPLVAEHEFPYRWYLATITGDYYRWDEKGQEVFKECNGLEYGFARSLEAGDTNWAKNRNLSCGNPAVKIEKKK